MKGLEIQFKGISNFLENNLKRSIDELTWDVYLLNLQKMTMETFGLVTIILDNPDTRLPSILIDSYRGVISKLKEYFVRRPKGRLDSDSESEESDSNSKMVD